MGKKVGKAGKFRPRNKKGKFVKQVEEGDPGEKKKVTWLWIDHPSHPDNPNIR